MKLVILAATMSLGLVASGATAAGMGNTGKNGMTTQSTDANASMRYRSNDEQMMYQNHKSTMRGFFTDNSMTHLKPKAAVRKQFMAMDADSQASMKTACRRAGHKRGSYGSVTEALCAEINAM